ncbi:MAG: PorV/PorQ family protein [Candidatus Neomarinimicrobiota bacterium]
MKNKRFVLYLSALLSLSALSAQSEAGAIFLLISPGARAGGMGEAQVAVANDAYASYWNPAGLGFLKGSELALMHVNWLPNLADDLYYEFLAYRKHIKHLGTVGGHIIYLNLGEQLRTSEFAVELGTFTTYMMAVAFSYSSLLSPHSSLGINTKITYQHLASIGAGAEKGKGTSTDFGFDIGYLRKGFINPRLDLGLTVTNIGPKVAFIDAAQADPQPTNLTLGLQYRLVDSEFNRLSLVYDVDKLLVASYPDMDWDGDGKIGGYDTEGHVSLSNAEYNVKGKRETAHTDPIYQAIFTSWVDDWLLGGDVDKSPPSYDSDGKIGGWYHANDKNDNGIPEYGEMALTGGEFGDDTWGIYNEFGQKEVGTGKDRTVMNEVDKLVHNIGAEYWYANNFAMRIGYYYDKTGKIGNMTLGFGLRFASYGFDFGYIAGKAEDSLSNTMRFSMNMEF